jgi:hypothetical protein
MSWDVVLFHSTQQIESPDAMDEEQLTPIDFEKILAEYFVDILRDAHHCRIERTDFTIEYFSSDGLESNMMMQLYGETAIYALVRFAKKYRLQLFDTALGSMIDLDNPSANGYQNFQAYLQQVLGK